MTPILKTTFPKTHYCIKVFVFWIPQNQRFVLNVCWQSTTDGLNEAVTSSHSCQATDAEWRKTLFSTAGFFQPENIFLKWGNYVYWNMRLDVLKLTNCLRSNELNFTCINMGCLYLHGIRRFFKYFSLPCRSIGSVRSTTIHIMFSCDQAALWMVQSVRLSACDAFFTMFPSSWNFQELLPMTKVMSMQKVKVRGQSSRSQRSKPQINRFRTVTPVWIHIWWWNDAHSLMLPRRGALLFFKVIHQISRSHGSNNRRIWPRLGVSGL